MTQNTRGIVLRTVKYGETSIIASVYTEQFGIRSYLVNGVRKTSAKNNKAIMLQPAALLDMEVYHNELKNLQRIKEISWHYIYHNIYSDVIRNSIATFMVEILYKVFRQPEANADLFDFIEDAFINLDTCSHEVAANYAIWFSLQLPQFFGLKIQDPDQQLMAGSELYLDLMAGHFTDALPLHQHFLLGDAALATADFLKVMQPVELDQFKLNKDMRRLLLNGCLQYYHYHFQDFGGMRSWKVLQEVLG